MTSRADTPARPGRVVVRPPNWLGDAVLALPAMAAVREAFAGAHLAVAAPPVVAALFAEHTDARPDQIIALPSRTRDAVARLRAGRFEVGILLPNSFRSAWMFRRAGIPERWGYSTAGRGWVLTRRVRTPGRRDDPHQAEYYRVLVRGLGLPCDGRLPHVGASDAGLRQAGDLLASAGWDGVRPLVGLAPGAAYGQAKQWPPARVAAVVARLVRDAGATCVVVGAGHDRDAAREIESWLDAEAPDARTHLIDLVGRTSLGALAGVAARTDVFVSNDSGAMHLAAAVGRPVVALFGPTDERATRPLGDHDVLTAPAFCRPCLMRDCPIDHRCMKRIAATRVYDAVVARLAAVRGT
jgi:heptosyltransferase-2